MKNLLRAGAFLLTLTLAPLAPVGAHGKHARKRRRGRTHVVKTHDDGLNLTPGTPRRVSLGRNPTPGTPRGSIAGTPSTFPSDEARQLGAQVRRGATRGGTKSRGKRAVVRGHGKH
jgi:hypothetical protein